MIHLLIYLIDLILEHFWWSPERLLDRDLPLTKECDIYAYGIIMYEICTRGDPYDLDMEMNQMEPTGGMCGFYEH